MNTGKLEPLVVLVTLNELHNQPPSPLIEHRPKNSILRRKQTSKYAQ